MGVLYRTLQELLGDTAWRPRSVCFVSCAPLPALPPSSFFHKMAQQELSYADILNEVRREFAMRYIANQERPLTEVASLLGFSCLSAFSRWFKRQYGCSPSNWRKSQYLQA
jgi:AraC-like DNA-binding protein